MMLLSSLALLIAQPIASTHAIESKEAQSQKINLSPPLNVPLRLVKTQTHFLGDKQFKIQLVRDIVFKPSSNSTIIGHDISVEIIDIKLEGDPKIIGLLANAYPQVGSISQYSYDEANEKLTLLNADQLWESLIRSIHTIKDNAGARSDAQRAEDKKLFDSIENIPPMARQAILSQDMALILSFVGKSLPQNTQKDDNMLTKSRQIIDRQNGLIQEINDFYVSNQTGLVHKLMRTNQSQGDKTRKIVTEIEVELP